MKTTTTALVILALCGLVILGTVILERGGQRQAAQSQIALRELDARVAESEAARAEAETEPYVIAADWAGQTEYLETQENLERDRAQSDALIELALADHRARVAWRVYEQVFLALVVFFALACAGLYLVYLATLGHDAGNVRKDKQRAGDAARGLYG